MTKKNPEFLLERLTKTVSEGFPDDATRPSVLVSFIEAAKIEATEGPAPEGFERISTYYASVLRWADGKKTVVAKARAKTLAGALEALAVDFDRVMENPERYTWAPIATFTREHPPPSFWTGDGDFDDV
jgi:hypothetical protein